MAIPTFQEIMLPLLKQIADGETHVMRDVVEKLAEEFNLNPDERKKMLPSGMQRIFDNRVGWAKSYLKKAGFIAQERRGLANITPGGREALSKNPAKIDLDFLKQIDEFRKNWKYGLPEKDDSEAAKDETTSIEDSEINPEEQLELAHQTLNEELAGELLEQIKSGTPAFFEKLVVDLLIKMGYGGSHRDAGEQLGKTGDGGIDGSIKEDKLGLDMIYLQAKKWDVSIPISQVRDFAGALLAKKTKKGVFITTSTFPSSAKEYVKSIEPKIILIDGRKLTELMIEYDLGVSKEKVYEVKKIDFDYFLD